MFSYSSYVKGWLWFLKKFSILILALWFCVFLASLYFAPQFLLHTTNSILPPYGTESYHADQLLRSSFPGVATSSNIIALIETKDSSNVLSDQTKNFSLSLNKTLSDSKYGNFLMGNQGFYISDVPALQFKCRFVSPRSDSCLENGRTTLIIIAVDREKLHQDAPFTDYVIELVNNVKKDTLNSSYSVRLTGDLVFFKDINDGTIRDMGRMDSVALPLALLVLICILKSTRLMIIPLITIIMSTSASFMAMLPYAKTVNIASSAPSMMMSIIIAMSVDYSLFLLCRFKEEIRKGSKTHEAVEVMFECAGHTITVSGLTLAMCLFGMAFFPVQFIATQGVCSGMALLFCLIVNLTLTPAILLTFPNFFGNKKSKIALYLRKLKKIVCCCGKKKINDDDDEEMLNENDEMDEEEKILTTDEDDVMLEREDDALATYENVDANGNEKQEELEKYVWYRFSHYPVRFRYFVILATCAFVAPFAYYAFQFEQILDLSLMTPRGAESTAVYMKLEEEFGAGYLFPFQLVIQPPSGVRIMNDETFGEINKVIDYLVENVEGTEREFFMGLMCLPAPFQNTTAASLNMMKMFMPSVQKLIDSFVNKEETITYVLIFTKIDPFSDEGVEWLQNLRSALQSTDIMGGYTYLVAGNAAVMDDCETEVYKAFPMMIGIVIGLVFIIIAIAFRSVMVPIRSIFTLFCTLSLSYGAATFVYQFGALRWLGLPGLSQSHGLSWLSPVMAFSIIIGLGLDYDVFLLSRILEYRQQGYTEVASIRRGVYKTGPIITAAGLIMAIAFAGLLLCGEMALNQIAFYLVFSVLIDTFFIRTFLVPSIMAVLKRWNWWPVGYPNSYLQ